VTSRHHHRRIQYSTAPAILVVDVERFDAIAGAHVPFDAAGWELHFRMWRHGSQSLLVADAPATQPEVGQLAYVPLAADVATGGDFRAVFWARRISDGARDVWPVQEITIVPVAGGELVTP
jgi:hypothetical protein